MQEQLRQRTEQEQKLADFVAQIQTKAASFEELAKQLAAKSHEKQLEFDRFKSDQTAQTAKLESERSRLLELVAEKDKELKKKVSFFTLFILLCLYYPG